MDENVKDEDKHGKDIVQAPDHGLSGRECTYQTPDAGVEPHSEKEG